MLGLYHADGTGGEGHTVATTERSWQREKTRFRHTLAVRRSPSTSIWTGPFRCGGARLWGAASRPWVAHCRGQGRRSAVGKAGDWKPVKTKNQFPPSRPSLGNLAHPARLPLFYRTEGGWCCKSKGQNQDRGGGLTAAALFYKADRSRVNKTGQLDVLTTARQRPAGAGTPVASKTMYSGWRSNPRSRQRMNCLR